MLRFDYMHSDFDPIFLFLGEAQDLSRLAGLLRDFSREPRRVSVYPSVPNASQPVHLSLAPAEENFGMRPIKDGSFEWRLNAWQAGCIADRIEALTPTDNKSGSDILELGFEGEIPVKVSRGEFTDEFLVTIR